LWGWEETFRWNGTTFEETGQIQINNTHDMYSTLKYFNFEELLVLSNNVVLSTPRHERGSNSQL
jgi:hypothetical protein